MATGEVWAGDPCVRMTDGWESYLYRMTPLFRREIMVFLVLRFLNLHTTLPYAHCRLPPHLSFSFSIIDELASFMFQYRLQSSLVLGVLHFLHPGWTPNQDLFRCVPWMDPWRDLGFASAVITSKLFLCGLRSREREIIETYGNI